MSFPPNGFRNSLSKSPMATPRVCVLRAPGTNCDVETAYAFDVCGAEAERVHLLRLLENPRMLSEFQMLCVPGGFSYGDDIGAGVIFAQQLLGRLGDAIGEFLERDTLVLGICNGFQVLLKAGILPNGTTEWPPNGDTPRTTTLTWNDNGKYTALWVHLKVHSPHNVFLRGIDEIELPLAHAEGRLAVHDDAAIAEWEQHGQIAARYSLPPGSTATATDPLPYPLNPNGSVSNVAGLSDRTGRVLGLMPHPERFLHATQHPQWTRLRLQGDGAGMQLFRNAVEHYA